MSNDEYQQHSTWIKKRLKPDGYEVHMKYLELGGYGIFIGCEDEYTKQKEKLVNLELKEWIKNYGK